LRSKRWVGTEHSIDEEGLVRGGLFLHQVFDAPVQ
jgi:hypothetical protein